MKIALCLITLNEIDGCKNDIPLLDRTQFEEIFCLDGGSIDGTVEYLTEQGIEVVKQKKRGLNQAHIESVERCNCDAIVFFHPKGTIPIEDTYVFRKYFDQGYELVVASRMMKGASNEEDNKIIKLRKWFVLFMAFIAKMLFKQEGNTIWDSLHGFRGITVDAFNKIELSDKSPSVDLEMVCRSYKLHFNRIEFPTKEIRRKYGQSHFKAIPTGFKLIKYIIWEIVRK